MIKKAYFFVLIIITIIISSCAIVGGAIMIDTPTNIRNHKIIHNKIIPYIANVLEYNDYSATDNPQEQQRMRQIPTINNMNYDNVINCQDYALLFYALCKYNNIPCKLVGNFTLMHAYNQVIEGYGVPVDIEPQQGESKVYVFAMHDYDKTNPLLWKRINTHPDNIVMDIDDWNCNEGASPANMELFNYIIQNGKLP
jgi:hypothetical protein